MLECCALVAWLGGVAGLGRGSSTPSSQINSNTSNNSSNNFNNSDNSSRKP